MISRKTHMLDDLSGAQISEVKKAGSLQVFPLRWRDGNGCEYATLDEALDKRMIEVTEVESGGQVPKLMVINKSEHRVFLMAGEELVGGKQNRVLNASMMVPAKGEMPIPVTCVERGRWGYKSSRFSSGTTSSHSRLRSMMARQVSGSYKAVGAPSSDQAAVWGEVSRKMSSMGSRSSSDALHDLYSDYAKKLDAVVGQFSLPDQSNGAVFAINGSIVGADLFDQPVTFKKLWTKVIRSYAADALEAPQENPKQVQARQVAEWLAAARSAETHWFDSPGVGHDVRIEGKQLVGAMLVVEDQPVHLELFREEPA